MGDGRFAADEKAQPFERQIFQGRALRGDAQHQTGHAVALAHALVHNAQRQNFGVVDRAEAAAQPPRFHGFHFRASGDGHRAGDIVAGHVADDRSRRDGPQIVGPEQIEQGVGDLRQLVVQFLAQAAREEGKSLQNAFHIGIAPRRVQKGGQRRVALREFLAQSAQGQQLVLIVDVEAHTPPRTLSPFSEMLHCQGAVVPSDSTLSAAMRKPMAKSDSGRA